MMMVQGCEPDRVTQAKEEKLAMLQNDLQPFGVHAGKSFEVFLRAFKSEKLLEVWVRPPEDPNFQLFKSYPICQASGMPGPKLLKGDRQVPEGFYHINRFNPKSKFHLSLGLNYPNESDLVRADRENPGGDIFIHGDCMSIGCLAMTDDFIKEIYVLVLLAKENGQSRIPVHIFPARLTAANLERMATASPEWSAFWNELLPFYQYFEEKKRLPGISVLPDGAYQIENEAF
jgi:murein L,D-transpeptidase YafK